MDAPDRVVVVVRNLRAYADAAQDPTLADKLRAAAREIEQQVRLTVRAAPPA